MSTPSSTPYAYLLASVQPGIARSNRLWVMNWLVFLNVDGASRHRHWSNITILGPDDMVFIKWLQVICHRRHCRPSPPRAIISVLDSQPLTLVGWMIKVFVCLFLFSRFCVKYLPYVVVSINVSAPFYPYIPIVRTNGFMYWTWSEMSNGSVI